MFGRHSADIVSFDSSQLQQYRYLTRIALLHFGATNPFHHQKRRRDHVHEARPKRFASNGDCALGILFNDCVKPIVERRSRGSIACECKRNRCQDKVSPVHLQHYAIGVDFSRA